MNKNNISTLINEHNRDDVVLLVQTLLKENKITILELYDILKDTLYQIDCEVGDKECIWKEHIKSAIVRTIIETAYPYVINEVKNVAKKNLKVLVVCPPEEYHEIGAKMAHDYFLLSGYESIFIGANTPLDVIMNAIQFEKPNLIALSVTNYYHIINTKKLITEIKEAYNDITVLVGGQAFDEESIKSVNADKLITDFNSISNL